MFIPEKKDPKLPRVFNPPEFIRNIWGKWFCLLDSYGVLTCIVIMLLLSSLNKYKENDVHSEFSVFTTAGPDWQVKTQYFQSVRSSIGAAVHSSSTKLLKTLL